MPLQQSLEVWKIWNSPRCFPPHPSPISHNTTTWTMLSRSRHRMPREAKIEYLVMNVDRQPVVTAFIWCTFFMSSIVGHRSGIKIKIIAWVYWTIEIQCMLNTKIFTLVQISQCGLYWITLIFCASCSLLGHHQMKAQYHGKSWNIS
jgi:hypothetical protein